MRKTKEDLARFEGMAQALRIVKKSGIEGLEEELRIRNIINLPCNISKNEMNKFIDSVKESVYQAYLVLTIATLHDEFEFGQKELNDFMKRINEKSDCLNEDYCTWEDMITAIKEECNIVLNIDKL